MYLSVCLVAFAIIQLVITAVVLRSREPYYPDDMFVDEQIETSMNSLT